MSNTSYQSISRLSAYYLLTLYFDGHLIDILLTINNLSTNQLVLLTIILNMHVFYVTYGNIWCIYVCLDILMYNNNILTAS